MLTTRYLAATWLDPVVVSIWTAHGTFTRKSFLTPCTDVVMMC
jgi:hypothetical protein